MKIVLSVLHITNGKGGAERTAANLANEMTARGHEILIHSSTFPERDASYPLSPKVRHLKMSLDQGHSILTVRERIREFEPDVAFLFFFDRFLFWQYATVDGLGIGIGGQECTNPIRAVDNLARSKWFGDESQSAQVRHAFIAGLHGVRLTMPSYTESVPSVAKPSTFAFPNAYALARQPVDQYTAGRKTIINVSGLKAPNKNGAVLARAFANIADKYPDWDLRYYGGVNQAKTITDLLERKDLAGRIVVHGFTEDMYPEYARAHLHAICSFHEGNPNVVCEAMTHGIPTIGYSDCRGTNELVRHEKNGLLIAREDEIGNLTVALERLMTQPELRLTLGQEAYADAKALFDPATIFDQWEKLFYRIAEYKGRSKRLLEEQDEIDRAGAREFRNIREQYLRQTLSIGKKPGVLQPVFDFFQNSAQAIWRRAGAPN